MLFRDVDVSGPHARPAEEIGGAFGFAGLKNLQTPLLTTADG